ncbi:DUF2975 domain-containing protein [Sungkyunkwania multivorans]|uniref:DUF2975 domain-containing protein n=1 Tax=Sungkyunkwania multivorans TaxID=1173618 RepID=A0ABW3D147_9FLAO
MDIKNKITLLHFFAYAIVFLAVSVLLNDIREFNYERFRSFSSWASAADRNSSWFSRSNLIEWSYYVISGALFFWRGYLIYGFTKFISIISEIEKQNYFGKRVISDFKKIGDIFISYTIGTFVLKTLLAVVGSYSFKMLFELKEELTYLIPAGLAFYLLAEIFKRARALKNENDLTI